MPKMHIILGQVNLQLERLKLIEESTFLAARSSARSWEYVGCPMLLSSLGLGRCLALDGPLLI